MTPRVFVEFTHFPSAVPGKGDHQRRERFAVDDIESVEEAPGPLAILHMRSGRSVKVAATPDAVLSMMGSALDPYGQDD